jgi:hypothetical protein
MKIRGSTYLIAAALALPFAVALYQMSQSRPVVRTFPAQDIRRVVLRCYQVDNARVENATDGKIRISGVPSGGVVGYHTSDPSWRPTKARDWGMDFVSKRYGDNLGHFRQTRNAGRSSSLRPIQYNSPGSARRQSAKGESVSPQVRGI